MNPLMLARLGLMGAGRLGRGASLAARRLFAKKPFVKRPAAAGMDAPYTPLRPYTTTRAKGAPVRLRRDPTLAPGATRTVTHPDIPAQMPGPWHL